SLMLSLGAYSTGCSSKDEKASQRSGLRPIGKPVFQFPVSSATQALMPSLASWSFYQRPYGGLIVGKDAKDRVVSVNRLGELSVPRAITRLNQHAPGTLPKKGKVIATDVPKVVEIQAVYPNPGAMRYVDDGGSKGLAPIGSVLFNSLTPAHTSV